MLVPPAVPSRSARLVLIVLMLPLRLVSWVESMFKPKNQVELSVVTFPLRKSSRRMVREQERFENPSASVSALTIP